MPQRRLVLIADLPFVGVLMPTATGLVIHGALMDDPRVPGLGGLEDLLQVRLHAAVAASLVTARIGGPEAMLDRVLVGLLTGGRRLGVQGASGILELAPFSNSSLLFGRGPGGPSSSAPIPLMVTRRTDRQGRPVDHGGAARGRAPVAQA